MSTHEETSIHHEPAQRKPRAVSDRKIVVIYKDTTQGQGVAEFDTKSEAAAFVNNIGAENVTKHYTGAKPGTIRTKAVL